jgi:hypothetical protein
MKTEEMQKARRFSNVPQIPITIAGRGALDRVRDKSEEEFETQLKKDFITAYWFIQFQECGGGWGDRKKRTLKLGAKEFSDDVGLEDAVMENPEYQFTVRDASVLLNGSRRALTVNYQVGIDSPTQVYTKNRTFADLLDGKVREMSLVPDLHDKDAITLVIPREEGYGIVRIRETGGRDISGRTYGDAFGSDFEHDLQMALSYVNSFSGNASIGAREWHSGSAGVKETEFQWWTEEKTRTERRFLDRKPFERKGHTYTLQIQEGVYDADTPMIEAIEQLPETYDTLHGATLKVRGDGKERADNEYFTKIESSLMLESQHPDDYHCKSSVLNRDFRNPVFIADPKYHDAVLFRTEMDDGRYSLVRIRQE